VLRASDFKDMDIFALIQYSFVQQAFIAGVCVAALSAAIGLFLILRKMSLIGDGLSHVSFGAIALGLFFGIFPLYVALPVTLLSAYLILQLAEKTKMYSDSAIAIVSSLGVALGVILVSVSSGLNLSLFSYLFGNILTITTFEVYAAIIFTIAALVAVSLFYHDLFYATFDEESARASGIKTKWINLALVLITALTVVLAVRMVGVLLVSALLVIPPVTALQVGRGFAQTLTLSVILAVGSMVAGIVLSLLINWPTGATIVVVNFAVFCVILALKKIPV
jgi:zinc transport system permease protein